MFISFIIQPNLSEDSEVLNDFIQSFRFANKWITLYLHIDGIVYDFN